MSNRLDERSLPQQSNMKFATTEEGFHQRGFKIENAFRSDFFLPEVINYFIGSKYIDQVNQDLDRFGAEVMSDRTFELIADCEKNLPYVKQYDTFGNRVDQLVTSEGWKRLKEFGLKEGIVAIGYERKQGDSSRVYQFIKDFVFTGSSALVTCPMAMTDGCARALEVAARSTGQKEPHPAYYHLISRDPEYFWTSGQWMTERPGGSDVSETETIAVRDNKGVSVSMTDKNREPLQIPTDYSVNGFKFFSSATESEVSIILAQDSELESQLARKGPRKPLGCFLAHVHNGGARIVRLKEKFGTVGLPTAELELRDVRAERIGKMGDGVRTISTVLQITRIYSAIGSAGFLRRAIQIATEYSKHRKVFGKVLAETPAHCKILASLERTSRGHVLMSVYASSLLGKTEMGTASADEKTLFRIVPALAKILVCKESLSAISECMEALGGVGYLTHDPRIDISRLYRDAQVNAIWEGTTNVLASDVTRVLLRYPAVFAPVLERFFAVSESQTAEITAMKKDIHQCYTDTITKFFSSTSESEKQFIVARNSRLIALTLARLVVCRLLVDLLEHNLKEECKLKEKPITLSIDDHMPHSQIPLQDKLTCEFWIYNTVNFKDMLASDYGSAGDASKSNMDSDRQLLYDNPFQDLQRSIIASHL